MTTRTTPNQDDEPYMTDTQAHDLALKLAHIATIDPIAEPMPFAEKPFDPNGKAIWRTQCAPILNTCAHNWQPCGSNMGLPLRRCSTCKTVRPFEVP
jgi:hypothetical protein